MKIYLMIENSFWISGPPSLSFILIVFSYFCLITFNVQLKFSLLNFFTFYLIVYLKILSKKSFTCLFLCYTRLESTPWSFVSAVPPPLPFSVAMENILNIKLCHTYFFRNLLWKINIHIIYIYKMIIVINSIVLIISY